MDHKRLMEAREQAAEAAERGLRRRDDRIVAAIETIDRYVDPSHKESATLRAVEILAYRRHTVARGEMRNVSGQSYDATGKRLRPADAMRNRASGKRTGMGADRIRSSNHKQASIAFDVSNLRATVAAYVNGSRADRKLLRPVLHQAGLSRGLTLAEMLESFR